MEEQNKGMNQQFLLGLFGGVAVVAVIGMVIMGAALVSSQGKSGNVAGALDDSGAAGTAAQQQQAAQGPETEPVTAAGVETFDQKKGATICKEGGKPVVYLFSTTWCPHCTWVKDTFDKVVAEYVKAGKIAAYHWELDTNDNTLTSAKETSVPADAQAVYQEFNPSGSIPTFVIGCKYFRVGNGHEAADDLAAEEKELRAAIDAVLK
ncbi:MAG: hypothetical protein BWY53_00258 [Parcubacteria group bacterium ADurb.Bin326]|nr:MAG: hypothetical protein BWY53_00258 [Parcubacteria group bacterium ADurb.Bin326]